MSDDKGWDHPPVGFRDLETRASAIYDAAMEQVGMCGSVGESAKCWDTALKALRLQAELREKHDRPEQLDKLSQQIEQVEKLIKNRHAGIADREGAEPPRQGQPPPWRQ